MGKFAIRLLTLAIFATALAAFPAIPPADAATDGSTHAKKHTKKVQRHLVTQTARDPGKSPFPPMDEDMDRKRASGGGGY
jgi:hypothetical protein